uniref:Uncharacterized protein n=1 Tax=Cairina moschata TaxID=8855 RepID=A0A8C3BMZ2_CAIMO
MAEPQRQLHCLLLLVPRELRDSTNSSENMYTMMNPIGPAGTRPNFPMGPGPEGPMGGMSAMEPHHMNGSLGSGGLVPTLCPPHAPTLPRASPSPWHLAPSSNGAPQKASGLCEQPFPPGTGSSTRRARRRTLETALLEHRGSAASSPNSCKSSPKRHHKCARAPCATRPPYRTSEQQRVQGQIPFFFFFLKLFFFFPSPATTMCFKREKCEVFRSQRKGPGRRRRREECASRGSGNTCAGFYCFPTFKKKKKNADQVLSNAIK